MGVKSKKQISASAEGKLYLRIQGVYGTLQRDGGGYGGRSL